MPPTIQWYSTSEHAMPECSGRLSCDAEGSDEEADLNIPCIEGGADMDATVSIAAFAHHSWDSLIRQDWLRSRS